MTKKQFILTGKVEYGRQYQITDIENNYAYENNKVDKQKLCDLINNLLEENKELKKEIRIIEKVKDSFYDKVKRLLTEHIKYNKLKPENTDSVIKELNKLEIEIFE